MRNAYDPADKPDDIDRLVRLLGAKRSVAVLLSVVSHVGLKCLQTESGSASKGGAT